MTHQSTNHLYTICKHRHYTGHRRPPLPKNQRIKFGTHESLVFAHQLTTDNSLYAIAMSKGGNVCLYRFDLANLDASSAPDIYYEMVTTINDLQFGLSESELASEQIYGPQRFLEQFTVIKAAVRKQFYLEHAMVSVSDGPLFDQHIVAVSGIQGSDDSFGVRVMHVFVGEHRPVSPAVRKSFDFRHNYPPSIHSEQMAVDSTGAVMICTTRLQYADESLDSAARSVEIKVYPFMSGTQGHTIMNQPLAPTCTAMSYLRLDQETRLGATQLAFFLKYRRNQKYRRDYDAAIGQYDDNAIARFSI